MIGPRLASVVVLCAWPLIARAEVHVPGRAPIEAADFERHVMGLFSKAGCNNGSCHGSFQGKGGFRLSLFGYDPAKDAATLTREVMGRRIDLVDPEKSLLLLKATGSVPHEGGVRITKGSWQYQILLDWISTGARRQANSGAVVELTLSAPEYLVAPLGVSQQLKVTARFQDGSAEDVTAFCDFKIQDDAVAEITPLGRITASRPGDTGLVVSYRGVIRAVRVLVPAQLPPGTQFPESRSSGFIDREVSAKLRLLNMIPSGPASDAEFLRRITIDTTAALPSPDEVRAFLADTSPNKREKKIDELLAHPLHAALWATKLSDVTGNNTDALEQPNPSKPRRSQMWHDWLRKRVHDNVPYDQIVHDILTATSREGLTGEEWIEKQKKLDDELQKGWESSYADRKTLDLFWRRQQQVPIDQWGEKVAAAFLGVRLECAQCHKHPTDRWTQVDYRAFANAFQQVAFGASPEMKSALDAINAERRSAGKQNNQFNQMRELFLARIPEPNPRQRPNPNNRNPRVFRHPETNEPLPPKALGGPTLPIAKDKDAREGLWEWMRSPENPYFARSFVNRVWAQYFGVGLVEPVDDFSQANPPTNARLLELLAKDFIDHNFDIRRLERTILQSEAYQRSSSANLTNKFDKNNFARGYVRPMMAEAVVDVLNCALGVEEQWNNNEAPKGRKMVEIGASRLNNGNVAYALRIFGRPARTTACDCERSLDPALPQTLYRMTDPGLMQKMGSPNNRLASLMREQLSDDEVLDELFLACLTRFPSEKERAAFVRHRSRSGNRASAFHDTLWALINTREFILNH